MVMAAVLSNRQECWPGISTSHPQHEWLLYPSDYSDCLRITTTDWIMKEIVDIGILSENRCHGNVHDATSAAFKTHENDNMRTDFGINDNFKCNISDIDSDNFEDNHSGKTTSKMNMPALFHSSDSESGVHCIVNEGNVRQLLPERYDYSFHRFSLQMLTHLAFHVNLK